MGKFGVYKVSIDPDNATEKAEKLQFAVFEDPFDEFTLQDLVEECDPVSPTGANARFFYFFKFVLLWEAGSVSKLYSLDMK